MENENVKETQNTSLVVTNVNELKSRNASDIKIFTSLNVAEDTKKIFNLENNECDYKLNDCEGQSLRIVDVYIKSIASKMDEPEIDEETGAIIRDTEYKKITILIDDQGKSYVTSSKTFCFAMMNYLGMFGIENVHKGIELKITKKAVKGSKNKALSFELI